MMEKTLVSENYIKFVSVEFMTIMNLDLAAAIGGDDNIAIGFDVRCRRHQLKSEWSGRFVNAITFSMFSLYRALKNAHRDQLMSMQIVLRVCLQKGTKRQQTLYFAISADGFSWRITGRRGQKLGAHNAQYYETYIISHVHQQTLEVAVLRPSLTCEDVLASK